MFVNSVIEWFTKANEHKRTQTNGHKWGMLVFVRLTLTKKVTEHEQLTELGFPFCVRSL